jgi:5-enolpyruvylshikimate-3-phosphate synthase
MVFWVLDTFIWNLNILNPSCVAKTYPNFWEDLKILQN